MRVTPWTLLLLVLLSPPLFPDETDAAAWLRAEPRARAYDAAQPAILGVFDDAREAGLPPALLVEKLMEGVSKRVPPDLLVAALRAESERLSIGADILSGQASAFLPARKEAALRAISLLLASGSSPRLAESLVSAATASGRDSADTVDALQVLAQVRLSIHLPDVLLQSLGAAMLQSGMPRAAFGSIPSMLLQARANGMSPEETIADVVRVLQSGGGLIQVEDRLQAASGNAPRGSMKERGGPGLSPAPGGVPGGGPSGTPGRRQP